MASMIWKIWKTVRSQICEKSVNSRGRTRAVVNMEMQRPGVAERRRLLTPAVIPCGARHLAAVVAREPVEVLVTAAPCAPSMQARCHACVVALRTHHLEATQRARVEAALDLRAHRASYLTTPPAATQQRSGRLQRGS